VPGNAGAQSGALARDRPPAQTVPTGRPARCFKTETLPSRYLRQRHVLVNETTPVTPKIEDR
jgi:hypothetical protein